jgi:tetratricopeptide (TPR) repeat protein
MLFFVLWLLQSAAPKPPTSAPPPSERVAPIPGSKLLVRLDLPAFTTEERHAQALKQALGARGVFVGVLSEDQASLELVVDPESEIKSHMTDAEWRDYNLKDSGSLWKYFDLPGMLGGESTLLFEGSGSHDFHAFTVRGGHLFDLHLSESFTATTKPRINRARFVEIASTLRLAIVRYGKYGDLPSRFLEVVDQALQRTDTRAAYLADLAKASPDDYAVPLAAAEIARALDRPAAEQIEGYTNAVRILAARTDLALPDRMAQVVAEVGLAFACLDASDPEKVVPHLDAAQRASNELSGPFKAGVLYDRACAEARLGKAEVALEHLKEASKIEPGALQRALHEKDLAAVRELPWFKSFFAGDKDNR